MRPPFRGTSRYELVRELGVGGMGVVYEARDRERGNRRVALKVLQADDADSIARLKREFRALRDVRHPNLVSLYELAADGDAWFFTLELVEGIDFLEWVRATPDATLRTAITADLAQTIRSPARPTPTIEVERLRSAFRQLVEGVAALHAFDRLHRDLKPSNVLVTPEGRVVILDFGLVAELGGGSRSLSEEGGRAVVGTVAYMAPEQAASGPLSASADWYAVGVMLFQALTGRLPFEGAPIDVMLDKQRRPAPTVSSLWAGAPPELDALCCRLLATQPGDRPSVAELHATLGARAPTQVSSPRALLGREEALERLGAAFDRTRQTGPQIVRIEGAAGIGKTALLKAFALQMRERGAVVLSGRCHEREAVPFKAVDPLIDALTRELAQLPPERVDSIRPRDASLLAAMFPVLKRLPAFRDAPVRDVAEPLERLRRAHLALRELFDRLGERVPLVVLIDDAQWGDADSLALMEAVLRPPEPPTVLVVTSIRGQGPALPIGVAPVDRLPLLPLPPERCVELALEAGVEPDRATSLARESAGNPLLLTQLIESADEGLVTLDGLWRKKLERLQAEARRALDVACLAFTPLTGRVAELIAEAGADAVTQLAAAHLVRLLPDSRVEPWHEGLRTVVSASIEPRRAAELHERLATALVDADPEAGAAHFSAAGAGDRAAEATLRGAARAQTQLAFSRAAALYRRVLELLPADDRRRATIAIELGTCLSNAGQGTAAAAALTAAVAEPGLEQGLVPELRRRAAEQLLVSGHVDDGLAAIAAVLRDHGMRLAPTPRRALAALIGRRVHLTLRGRAFDERSAAEVAPSVLRRIDACWSVAVGLGMVDTIRGASFQTRQLLLALDVGEPWRVARALAAEAAFVATDGVTAQRRARTLISEARALCDRVGDARLRGLVLFCEGLTRFLVGEFAEARSLVAEAEQLLRDAGLGVSWEAASARLFSIWSLFYLGELSELSTRVPGLIHEAQSRGDRYAVTSLSVGLSNVALLAADRPAHARATVHTAMADWKTTHFHFQHYWALLSEGLISLYEGTPQPALDALLKAWPLLERTQLLRIENVRIEALSLRGRLALAAGKHELANEAVRRLRRERARWAQGQALALEALLRPERFVDRLTEAIRVFDAAGMRLFGAAARLRLGAAQPDEVGAANTRAALAWFATQDVLNPRAFSRMLVPEPAGRKASTAPDVGS